MEHALKTIETATVTELTPLVMLDRAVSSGASPDTLERLMALQERWEANQAKKAFDNAIGLAKAEIPPILKTKTVSYENKRTNDWTDYKHETLPGMAKVIDPILHKHGLSYRYTSRLEGDKIFVTCIVSHRDGHKEETTLPSLPDASGGKNSVQAIGSAATYLQRYTLKLALGIAATDDMDGAAPPETGGLITAEQFQEIQRLIDETSADERKVLDRVKGESLEALTFKQANEAIAALTNYKRKLSEKQAPKANLKLTPMDAG